MVILETKRLTLRQFRLADTDALKVVFEDPEVMRFGEGVKPPEWVTDWIQKKQVVQTTFKEQSDETYAPRN